MAPILIDETGIKRFGIISVCALVLTFIAGYLTGNQQSGFFSEAGGDVPQVSVTDTTASKDKKSSGKQAGSVAASKPEINKQPVSNKKSTPVKTSSKNISSDNGSGKNNSNNTEAKKSAARVASKQSDMADVKSIEQTSEDQEADGNHIKYSIQTAVYGQLSRAEKNMNKLLDKNIEAYVTDYINKNNKTWYNVRFGYFRNKKSALAALDDYKQSHGGDGYLVNFSAERIVDFDEQKYYEDSMDIKAETGAEDNDVDQRAAEQSQAIIAVQKDSQVIDTKVIPSSAE
jgi:cell division septation protein DedD